MNFEPGRDLSDDPVRVPPTPPDDLTRRARDGLRTRPWMFVILCLLVAAGVRIFTRRFENGSPTVDLLVAAGTGLVVGGVIVLVDRLVREVAVRRLADRALRDQRSGDDEGL